MSWILLGLLTLGALLATFAVMARASRAYEGRRRAREPGRWCSTCRAVMTPAGVEDFSVAGTAGERWRELFGEAWKGARGTLPLEVYTCPVCRRVELALPPAAGE